MAFFLVLFILCSVGAATEDIQTQDTPASLPSSFFWGDHGGHNYLTRIQNEHAPLYCKASWALSTVAALSDRLKISHSGEGPDVVLSSQVLLNCAAVGGCSGGVPDDVFKYIGDAGIPDETCQNYEGKEGKCDALGICRDCVNGDPSEGRLLEDSHCFPVEKFSKYGVKDNGEIVAVEGSLESGLTVQLMQEEIHAHGPITCGITPPPEFLRYKEGVFSGGATNTDVHYVNIVGWHVSEKEQYWIIRNCWGESWGNGGFGKIEMGVNALGIESACFFGTPYTLETPPSNINLPDDIEDRGLYRVRKNTPTRGSCDCVVLPPEDAEKPLRFSKPTATNLVLPASYDIRDIDGVNYATLDKNQHIPQYCGSCWAFGAVSALADRFSVLYGQAPPLFDLATQVVLNCISFFGHGCRGGWPLAVYIHIKYHGIPHESCSPYLASDRKCTAENTCKQCLEKGTCTAIPPESYRHFGVVDIGSISGEEEMKREILSGGPIVCSIAATDDFHAYAGGILIDSTCSTKRNHAVEVAGWGEEDGVPYWIIRNSWGTYWGENGWARVARGSCDLGLSTASCDWATPMPIHGTLPYQSFGGKEVIV